METTAYIALSRQMALRRHMDVGGNYIANMTASAFKAEALMYEPVLSDAGAASGSPSCRTSAWRATRGSAR